MKTQKLLHGKNAIPGQGRTSKKLPAVLLAAVVLLTLLPITAFAADGEKGTTDGFEWMEYEGAAIITGYTGTDTVITIPGTIDNNGVSLPVYEISADTFSGKTAITAVTIPESVLNIGMRAFYQCSGLTSVTIPAAVEYIDEQAFDGCTSIDSITFGDGSQLEFISGGAFSDTAITSITIPAGVTTIREGAFMGCSKLTSIDIPAGVKKINDETFSGCSALTSINIPAGVTSFGYSAFDGCSALTAIDIPAGVTSFGYSAFRGCTAITLITIPAGVEKINDETFSGCTSLTAVNFAADTILNAIGNSAFQGCAALSSISIPVGVGTIGNSAFQGCTNLATVSVEGDGLNTIGSSAFQDCTALSSITIPRYMNTIGNSAFQGCTSLSSVNFVDDAASQPKTIGSSAFQGCTALTSANIPRRVTAIGSSAFSGCTNLATVNFTSDSNLTSIGDNAFQNCTTLTSVSIPAGVTSIGSNAFQGCTSLVKATVNSKTAAFGSNVFSGTALDSDGVYGYDDSTAETFCTANTIPFHYLTDGETVIITTSLPNGTANVPYSVTLVRIGDAASVTWSIQSGSLPDGLSLDADTGAISGAPTASGSSTFTVKAENTDDAADSDTQELTITIGKTTPTAADLSYDLTAGTYNGSPQPLTVTGNAGVGAITVKYDGSETAPVDAGTYAVTADIAEGTDFGPATGVSLGNYTIGKTELTITGGSVAAKTYDGTTAAHVTALTFSGLQNGETLTIDTDYTVSSASFNSADAGAGKTVTVTAALVSTGTTARNYTLANPSLSLTGQTIGKADFTVPDVSKLVTYTDTGSQEVDIAVLVADKKLSGDTLTYQAGIATGPNADIVRDISVGEAGMLTFTVSGGTAGDTATVPVTVGGFTNYNDVTVNVVVTLTGKALVTVTLPAPDKTYDGNPAAASASADGIPGADFSYTWLDSNGTQLAGNTPPTNAGSYQVKVEISGDSASIYTGEATVSFTIAKKTVTVRADDKSVNRADILPAPTVSYSGFVGTDSAANALEVQAEARLNVTDSSAAGTSVIDFAAQAVLNSTIGANYTLSHVNGTLTIISEFAGGDGTAGDPFQIKTAEQLNSVRDFLGAAYKDTYFWLTAPIDLSSFANWEPIGDETNPFCGHVYGTVYDAETETYVYQPISNLTINRPDEDDVGLFGYCSGADIDGIAIRNANITGGHAVGALVGQTANSPERDTVIRYCSATGTVTAINGYAAGGLVGMATDTEVSCSYSTASVTGTLSNAGGLVGYLSNSLIRNCYATGPVTSTGTDKYAGGLVGWIDSMDYKIAYCYAAGKVTGEGETGGLVGHSNTQAVIASYFNIGNASSSDDGTKGIGVEVNNLVYTSNYFEDWDFDPYLDETWRIDPGASYPYLRKNEQTPHPAPPVTTSARIAGDAGDSRYNAATKTLTLTYGGGGASLLAETITPADGLVTWSCSNVAVIDIWWGSSGDLTVEAVSAGTAIISLNSSDGSTLDSITVVVKPVPLQVTGDFEVENKEYDGSVDAFITTTTLSLDTSNCIGKDAFDLTVNFVATFTDPDAGQDKTVSLSASTLTGLAAGNYVLDFSLVPAATAAITPKQLTIGGSFTAQSKAYDGTTDAAIASSNLTLIGLVGSDDVTLVPVLAFDTPDIATGKTVSLTADSSLTGAKAGNYTLSVAGAPTYTSGVITDKPTGGGSSGGGGRTSSAGSFEIPPSFISDPNSGKTLTLGNDFASVTIPSNMLANIPGITGKKAGISIGQGDKSTLPDEVKTAIGDRPLISLSLLIDGKQTDWSNPGAPVTVSIPYTPTEAELANPESIVVWYIDGSGNPQCVTNGRYDPATGTVTFNVTHFSDYAVVCNPVSFNDVKSEAWYYRAVSFIAARDITGGTGGGNFSPDAHLTRGDFLVLLMKAYGIAPDTSPADNFSDAGNTYYTGYLTAAKRLGISAGVGNNLFAPEKEITRQEMFTLLYNALKVIGQLPRGDSGKTLSDFSDSSSVADWAKEALTLLVKTDTVGGSGGKLNPTGTTTRAEMAQVLYNLLGR